MEPIANLVRDAGLIVNSDMASIERELNDWATIHRNLAFYQTEFGSTADMAPPVNRNAQPPFIMVMRPEIGSPDRR